MTLYTKYGKNNITIQSEGTYYADYGEKTYIGHFNPKCCGIGAALTMICQTAEYFPKGDK